MERLREAVLESEEALKLGHGYGRAHQRLASLRFQQSHGQFQGNVKPQHQHQAKFNQMSAYESGATNHVTSDL
ncbi:hypothetical protein Q3G72_004782 [Acer saccharum]|nr:hypothetical protein Q3G72_017515 [Acer saccharum]KAK1566839.1 hypothetical protein Q3G72_004782 [Acer saccharum]